jgi:hypothetical protein
MKKIIFFLILQVILINVYAQFSEKNALYVSGEFARGSYAGINLGINYVYNQNYSLRVGRTRLVREAHSKPADFFPGAISVFSLGLGRHSFDRLDTYHILVGKIVKLHKSGLIRLNMAGGIGYTKITEPTNWKPAIELPFLLYILGANYTFDVHESSTASFIVHPTIEFPLTRYIGLTLNPMWHINSDRPFKGVGVGIMTGLLR